MQQFCRDRFWIAAKAPLVIHDGSLHALDLGILLGLKMLKKEFVAGFGWRVSGRSSSKCRLPELSYLLNQVISFGLACTNIVVSLEIKSHYKALFAK